MSNRAWVTLATNDSYGLGALVLAHSLRGAASTYPIVVLITPSVTDAMRERLRAVFADVITVDVLDSQDAAHLALLRRPELGITFTKIHCWNLTQFDKCVFLDADTLVVQNCDELFDREELSAAPDVGWPDCFNSGVFVFSPSKDTFDALIKFAQEQGSFDGGDQGLLNSFFSDWARGDINKHLPFLYNVTSAAFYSYLPALKHYGQNVKIIHFIGAAKPWLQQFNWESRSVDAPNHLQEFLQLWWDLFVTQVHPSLDITMTGVAGNLARVVPGAQSFQRDALDELTRRQGWEAGNIDCMGADSFDNIWAKISQTLSRSSPPKQSPPREPAPLQSEPEPIPQEPVAAPVEVAKEAVTDESLLVKPTPEPALPAELPKSPDSEKVVVQDVEIAASQKKPESPVLETVPKSVIDSETSKSSIAPSGTAATTVDNTASVQTIQPIAVPLPVVEAVSEPVVKAVSEPVLKAVSKPAVEAVPKPAVEPVSKPAVEPVPKPAVEAVQKPAVEPVPKPAVEAVQKPAVEPVPKSAVEPVPEPVIEVLPEPVVKAVSETVIVETDTVPKATVVKVPESKADKPSDKQTEKKSSVEKTPAPVTVEAPITTTPTKKETLKGKTEPSAVKPTDTSAPVAVPAPEVSVEAPQEVGTTAAVPEATPEKASQLSSSDSPPLAHTPSKDETPTLPAAKCPNRACSLM